MEIEDKINAFLLSQLPEEPEMTSALMIYTLNKDKDKAKVTSKTIQKHCNHAYENYSRPRTC